LEYFRQSGWEDDWIEKAEELVYRVYTADYEGKEGPAASTADTEPVSISVITFNFDINQYPADG
jgi:hypothetical protein